MTGQHERRTGINRRRHYVALPRAFERRRGADSRKHVLVEEERSAPDQGKLEAYWGA